MRDSWLDLIAGVLRPARPRLGLCLHERELHLAARRPLAERRAREMVKCEAQIEVERAAVLAANDGVISSRMRELEREWLRISRADPDGDVMDLWARIAPISWVDRKRWRDSAPFARSDAAVSLAADPDGVEAAEAAAEALRGALATWGLAIGRRIRWRWFERDDDPVVESLAEPLRAARAVLSRHEAERVVLSRALDLEFAVHEAACRRLPERPLLARELGHAAYLDCLWRAAPPSDRPNPVSPLRALWKTGYAIGGIDASGITLEIPQP